MSRAPNLLSLLRQRNPSLLWLGQLVSSIGDNFEYIALLALAYKISGGSALATGGTMVSFTIPFVLVSIFSSVLVDRWDRRRTMLVADIVRGVIILIPPLLFLWGRLELWHLYLYSALYGATTPFFNNANAALLPSLVKPEEYQAANSLMQTSIQIAGIIGLAMGGVVIATIGIANAYFLDSFSFFFSAFTIFLIRIPRVIKTAVEPQPAGDNPLPFLRSWWQDFKEGLHFYRVERSLLWLLLVFSLVNFAFGPVSFLLMPLAEQTLQVGVEGFGWILSVLSVGSLLGALLMGSIGAVRHRLAWIFPPILVIGMMTILLPLVRIFPFSLSFAFFIGFCLPVANITSNTIFQERTPDNLRGRVFGTRNTIAQGLTPLSMILGGILADAVGVPLTFALCGALALLAVVPGLFVPAIKSINLRPNAEVNMPVEGDPQ
ncbi:MAG: MFS transporter [Coprothermobacterota bacterium]|nr:MFS transporter [Coprothermobacterota bacterium]